CQMSPSSWKSNQKRKQYEGLLKRLAGGEGPVKLKHEDLVARLLWWLIRLYPPARSVDFVLDALETCFSLVPDAERRKVVKLDDWRNHHKDWRNSWPASVWQNLHYNVSATVKEPFTEVQNVRMWQLMHWRDQPAPGVARMRPGLGILLDGCKAEQATDADIYDELIGPG